MTIIPAAAPTPTPDDARSAVALLVASSVEAHIWKNPTADPVRVTATLRWWAHLHLDLDLDQAALITVYLDHPTTGTTTVRTLFLAWPLCGDLQWAWDGEETAFFAQNRAEGTAAAHRFVDWAHQTLAG